jgi:hypothetical protein
MNFSDLLTPQEAAKLRRCSMRKQEVERATGRGPAYIRDGSRILYSRSDIDTTSGTDQPPRRGRPRKQPETATTTPA